MKVLKTIYAFIKGRLTEGDTYAALMGLAAWFQISPQLAEPALDIIVYVLGALGVLVPQKGEKKDDSDS